MAHPRLSVHAVSLLGMPLVDQHRLWQDLGVRRLSLIADQLADPALPAILETGCTIEAVTHILAAGPLPTDLSAVAAARDALARTIDAAGRHGARSVYMLTGGRGTLGWERAAAQFAAIVAPAVDQARAAGVALLIENASNLYVDLHLAHTLRDAITLAETAGVGLCIDHFHCWTEAGLADLVERALPLTGLVQLSDYVAGDRALPARAVPGDGMIPIAPFVQQLLALGYAHGFDLELIGPRIDAEDRVAAVTRGVERLSAMLTEFGA